MWRGLVREKHIGAKCLCTRARVSCYDRNLDVSPRKHESGQERRTVGICLDQWATRIPTQRNVTGRESLSRQVVKSRDLISRQGFTVVCATTFSSSSSSVHFVFIFSLFLAWLVHFNHRKCGPAFQRCAHSTGTELPPGELFNLEFSALSRSVPVKRPLNPSLWVCM